jgi:hypothetical protein
VCKPPPRQWRKFLSARQVLLGVAAVSLYVAGIFLKNSPIGITLIGAGTVVLLLAVLLPGITQVEGGTGFKITAAVRGSAEKLRSVFEEQRPDLELCAHYLCDDDATVSKLLTAAMARARTDWHGAIDSQKGEIRTYVLCWFVHKLMAESEFAGEQPATTPANNRLSELTTIQRVVLVLTSKAADVPIDEVADMVDLSPAEARAQLGRAEKVFEDAGRRGDV